MKTTAAQFKYFQGRVKHWAIKYGLHHARIDTVLESCPGDESDEDTIAWALYDPENSIARVGLSTFLDKGTQNKRLDQSAFHEVWEVILWPVRELLSARGYSMEQINGTIHDVIRRAENAEFGF